MRARVVRAVLMGDMRGFSKLSDEQVLAFTTESWAHSPESWTTTVRPSSTETHGVTRSSPCSRAPRRLRAALWSCRRPWRASHWKTFGLPGDLALRLSGHIGPVFSLDDPVLGAPIFAGSQISRTARIEPVTPAGVVYVTEAFAAALELAGDQELRCDYVGHMPAAKDYGRLRMYHLRRRARVTR